MIWTVIKSLSITLLIGIIVFFTLSPVAYNLYAIEQPKITKPTWHEIPSEGGMQIFVGEHELVIDEEKKIISLYIRTVSPTLQNFDGIEANETISRIHYLCNDLIIKPAGTKLFLHSKQLDVPDELSAKFLGVEAMQIDSFANFLCVSIFPYEREDKPEQVPLLKTKFLRE